MPEQTNIAIETIMNYLWVPLVGWVMGSARKHSLDNKERDDKLNKANERIAVVEATRMTREDVVSVIDNKFEKMDDKIDKLSDSLESKIDKLSDNVNALVLRLPKRSKD